MSEEPHKVIAPPEDDFERFVKNLAQLSPAAMTRSRNQLLFEAGRASTRVPSLWAWQLATGALAFLSLVLGLFLLWPSSPRVQIVERERVEIRYLEREPQAVNPTSGSSVDPLSASISATGSSPSESTPENLAVDMRKMIQMRNEVLRFGVEMLPKQSAADSPATQPVTERELNEPLYLPRGVYAAPGILKRRPPLEE